MTRLNFGGDCVKNSGRAVLYLNCFFVDMHKNKRMFRPIFGKIIF